MELPMKRAVSIVLVLGLIGAAGALAAGAMGDGEPVPSRCPEGTTERSSIGEFAGPAPDSREEAVRVELENLGMDASDGAIAAAVIAAGPGGNVGTEKAEVETSQGVLVTMTLKPLDPGWTVGGSSWCAPNAE
jgi:hypothetical protein